MREMEARQGDGAVFPVSKARRILRITVVLSLWSVFLYGAFGQASQPLSDEDRAADLKRRVIGTLNLRAGGKAAEVGCGDGFYTIPLARMVGASGKVYAEDINDAELRKLKQHLSESALNNVEVILGTVDDPKLPAGQLDAVLVANAYHEMSQPTIMLQQIHSSLRPGGTFVLMEAVSDRREAQSRDEQIKKHELAPKIAIEELRRAGFEIVELRDLFYERAPDPDGRSRWWILVARKGS